MAFKPSYFAKCVQTVCTFLFLLLLLLLLFFFAVYVYRFLEDEYFVIQ